MHHLQASRRTAWCRIRLAAACTVLAWGGACGDGDSTCRAGLNGEQMAIVDATALYTADRIASQSDRALTDLIDLAREGTEQWRAQDADDEIYTYQDVETAARFVIVIETLVDNPDLQTSGILAEMRDRARITGLAGVVRITGGPDPDLDPAIRADVSRLTAPVSEAMVGSRDYLLASHFADLCA